MTPCEVCGGKLWLEADEGSVVKCPACTPNQRARRTDPVTSHRAALSALPRAGTWQLRALDALVDAGDRGLTDYELALALKRENMRGSVAKYRGALVKAGWVEDSRRIRLTDTGSDATVWVAIPQAAKVRQRRGAA